MRRSSGVESVDHVRSVDLQGGSTGHDDEDENDDGVDQESPWLPSQSVEQIPEQPGAWAAVDVDLYLVIGAAVAAAFLGARHLSSGKSTNAGALKPKPAKPATEPASKTVKTEAPKKAQPKNLASGLNKADALRRIRKLIESEDLDKLDFKKVLLQCVKAATAATFACKCNRLRR